MKTIKQNKLGLFIVFVFVAVLCTFGLFTVNADNNIVFYTEEVAQSELTLGGSITIPKGKFGEKEATAVVIYPGGEIFPGDSEIVLYSSGRYEIRYGAVINGRTLSASKYFNVESKMFSFSGNGSVSSEYNDTAKRNGLKVNLSKGATLNYNEAINLNTISAENPLVQFTVCPNISGVYDAREITFTLTDASDKSNYVQIRVSFYETSIWSRVHTRANGQVWGGYENTALHMYNSDYGTAFTMWCADNFTSFSESYNNCFSNQFLSLYYTSSEKSVGLSFYHFGAQTLSYQFVNDLDNTDYQSVPWGGFKSDYAFLTVTSDNFSGEESGLLFTKIGNLKITSILTENDFIFDDSSSVNVNVDFGDYEEYNLPVGTAGSSYPVFSASYDDVYGKFGAECEIKVLYGYTRKNGFYKDVSNDYVYEQKIENASFKTPYYGVYGICYRVKNKYGEIFERVVSVKVEKEGVPISEVVISDDYQTITETGNLIYLANFIKAIGGKGIIKSKISVLCNNKSVEVQGNASDGFYIVPKRSGNYIVKYLATDIVGYEKELTYSITVNAPSAPSFEYLPVLPKYFIEESATVLPIVTMSDYRNGGSCSAKIRIIDGNGMTDYKNGDKYNFKADGSGYATVEYYFDSNIRRFKVPVIKVKNDRGSLMLEKYFYGDADIENTEQGVMLSASGEAKTEFIRNLLAKDLSADIAVNGLGTEFNCFSIKLTDEYDSSVSITISLVKQDGKIALICGKQKIPYSNIAEKTSAKFSYDEATQVFTVGGIFFKVEKDAYGNAFNGFKSGKVYMEFAFGDVNGRAEVKVSQIKNQKFNSVTLNDLIKPKIYKINDFGVVVRKIGDEISLRKNDVSYEDVLSPDVTVTVSVSFNNVEVSSNDGTKLKRVPLGDYDFLLTENGSYDIDYLVTDWSGKTVEYKDRIIVLDNVAPTIETGKYSKEIKLGEKFVLPDLKVSDNLTAEIICYTVAFDKNDKLYPFTDGGFTPTEKGEYTIVITALDEVGNRSEKNFTITVK